MNDETMDLANTLAYVVGLIIEGDDEDRQRMAIAYREAQRLVATIPLDNGDACPRITACLKRFDVYQTAGDAACVGWMLMAIEERANDKNLPGWEELQVIIDNAVKLLPSDEPTVH